MSRDKSDRQRAIADSFKARGIVHSLLTALRYNIKDVKESVTYADGRLAEPYKHATTWSDLDSRIYVFNIKCYMGLGYDICSAMHNAKEDAVKRKTLYFLDEVEHYLTFRPLRINITWPTNDRMVIWNEDFDTVDFKL